MLRKHSLRNGSVAEEDNGFGISGLDGGDVEGGDGGEGGVDPVPQPLGGGGEGGGGSSCCLLQVFIFSF